MELCLGGVSHVLSDEVSRYSKFRAKYAALALSYKDNFVERLFFDFKDFDGLVSNWGRVTTEIVSDVSELALNDLVDFGLYDVSKSIFLRDFYFKYDIHESAFRALKEDYESIVLEELTKSDKRRDRVSQSGGVVGGGFGLEGAAQGIAIATAANLAIRAVQGLGGLAASAGDSIKSVGRKKNIFENPSVREYLGGVVYELVFSVHYAIVDVVALRGIGCTLFALPGSEAVERSNAILENCRHGRIAEDQQCKLLASALFQNPFSVEIYCYWLEVFGDKTLELQRFYVSHGLGDIGGLKRDVMSSRLAGVDVSTIDGCDKAMALLKELVVFLAFSDVDSLSEKINDTRSRIILNNKVLAELSGLDSSEVKVKVSVDGAWGSNVVKEWGPKANPVESELLGQGRKPRSPRVGEQIEALVVVLFDLVFGFNIARILPFSNKGLSRRFNVPFENLFEAALRALQDFGFKLVSEASVLESTKEEGVVAIVAERAGSGVLFYSGVKAFIKFKKLQGGEVDVEIFVRWRQGKIWEGLLQSGISRFLK